MVLMSGWIAADAVDQRYRGEEAAGRASARSRSNWRRYDAGTGQSGQTGGGLETPSQRALAFFSSICDGVCGRHFHAVRVANPGRIPPHAEPLILFANHPRGGTR